MITESEQVIANLNLEYFCLIFIAALGVLQISAVLSGMRGISFFTRSNHSLIFTVMTLVPVLVSLFTWNERNPTAIVEGYQQFYLFSLAAFLAFLFNIVVSHLIQRNKLQANKVRYDGLEALKEATFFQALQHRFSIKR